MNSRFVISWFGLPVLLGLLVSGGCTIHQGNFTVASTKVFRVSDFELDKAARVKNVEGRDVAHIICVFPTKGNVSVKEAMDNALEQGNGDMMTDVTIDSWGFYIPYIYGQFGWFVKGDVVKTRKN